MAKNHRARKLWSWDLNLSLPVLPPKLVTIIFYILSNVHMCVYDKTQKSE